MSQGLKWESEEEAGERGRSQGQGPQRPPKGRKSQSNAFTPIGTFN